MHKLIRGQSATGWMDMLADLLNTTGAASGEEDWLRRLHSRLSTRFTFRGIHVRPILVHGRPKVRFDSRWLKCGEDCLTRELGDVLWIFERRCADKAAVWRAAVWQVKYRKQGGGGRNPTYRIDAAQMDLLANLRELSLDPGGGCYDLSRSPFLGWFCYAQAPCSEGSSAISTVVPARCWPRLSVATGARAVRLFLEHLSGTARVPHSADLQSDQHARSLVCEILRQASTQRRYLARVYRALCGIEEAIQAVVNNGCGCEGAGKPGRSPDAKRPFLVVHVQQEELQPEQRREP